MLARIDVAISTRLATVGYTVPPTPAQIADGVIGRTYSGGANGGITIGMVVGVSAVGVEMAATAPTLSTW